MPLERLDAGHVDHVVVGLAGGDHRPHHRILPHAEVDEHRTVVDLVRLADALDGLLLGERAHADAAVGLRQLDEVRHVEEPGRRLPVVRVVLGLAVTVVQVGGRIVVVVEQRLPLAHHAEGRVVQDRDLDRRMLQERGRHLLAGHLEAAVAVDQPHRLLVIEETLRAD